MKGWLNLVHASHLPKIQETQKSKTSWKWIQELLVLLIQYQLSNALDFFTFAKEEPIKQLECYAW